MLPRLKRLPNMGIEGGPGGSVLALDSLPFFVFERRRWIAAHANTRHSRKLRIKVGALRDASVL